MSRKVSFNCESAVITTFTIPSTPATASLSIRAPSIWSLLKVAVKPAISLMTIAELATVRFASLISRSAASVIPFKPTVREVSSVAT